MDVLKSFLANHSAYVVLIATAVLLLFISPKGASSIRRKPFSDRTRLILFISGLVCFFVAFIWLFLALLIGLTDTGKVLIPTVLCLIWSFSILSVYRNWVKDRTSDIITFGFLSLVMCVIWFVMAVETLPSTDPKNIYWVFDPPFVFGVAGVFALLLPPMSKLSWIAPFD
jgi:hypothetical protein